MIVDDANGWWWMAIDGCRLWIWMIGEFRQELVMAAVGYRGLEMAAGATHICLQGSVVKVMLRSSSSSSVSVSSSSSSTSKAPSQAAVAPSSHRSGKAMVLCIGCGIATLARCKPGMCCHVWRKLGSEDPHPDGSLSVLALAAAAE
jgi:hypothetical protein